MLCSSPSDAVLLPIAAPRESCSTEHVLEPWTVVEKSITSAVVKGATKDRGHTVWKHEWNVHSQD